MIKQKVFCNYCGVEFEKLKIEIHRNNFCCKDHFFKWNSLRISNYNSTKENPMNRPGGIFESRIKRGNMQRNRGNGKSYKKYLGRHEHHVIAEFIYCRHLEADEVVHHINSNKQDNSPSNLKIMSRSEHARLHLAKAGDATCHTLS